MQYAVRVLSRSFGLAVLVPLFLMFLAPAPKAEATWYGQSFSYTATYHFSSIAWNKPVRRVVAHTGALIQLSRMDNNDSRTIWQDVQDVHMTRVGDHFEASTVITAVEGGGSGAGYAINKGPVVQYWVYFEDGSSLITDTYMIPVLDREPGSTNQTFSILTAIRPISG